MGFSQQTFWRWRKNTYHDSVLTGWQIVGKQEIKTLKLKQLNGIQPSFSYYLHLFFTCKNILKCPSWQRFWKIYKISYYALHALQESWAFPASHHQLTSTLTFLLASMLNQQLIIHTSPFPLNPTRFVDVTCVSPTRNTKTMCFLNLLLSPAPLLTLTGNAAYSVQ